MVMLVILVILDNLVDMVDLVNLLDLVDLVKLVICLNWWISDTNSCQFQNVAHNFWVLFML